MLAIIDNYDSFTYNLFQYLSELTDEPIEVYRNDRITTPELRALKPTKIVISPGPGRPEGAGCSIDVVRQFVGIIPILGVCLGHQVIGAAFGAKIVKAKRIVHGKTEEMNMDGRGLFRNIPPKSVFTRYHSLVIQKESLPKDLIITATSIDGEIMGIRHHDCPIEGIQFHPESIASEYGKKILKNFLNYRSEPFEMPRVLSRLMERSDLTRDEAETFMEELTEGDLNNTFIAAFLTALNMKGVTPEEIAGFASVLKRKRRVLKSSKPVLDTCGTGGDGLGTFNISSMTALVAASCGARVAKHGNRGVSSKSGSADFYRELGVPIDLSPKNSEKLLEQTDFTFLFAPMYHGSMRHAAPVRRELGVKTVMNLLGPLVNPVGSTCQLIGVFSNEYCTKIAQAAKLLGINRVMVVHSSDGLDEISVCDTTSVVEIDTHGEMREYILDPTDFNIKKYQLAELKGGDPGRNAEIAREILTTGAHEAIQQIVCLNAGAALYIYGIACSIEEGYRTCSEALKSGKVREKVEQIIAVGKSLGE